MLIYFEPAGLCDLQRDLIIAPLPASKQLWEAGDEFMWKAESERSPGAEAAFGLAANGDLVKVDGNQPCQLHDSHPVLVKRPMDPKTPLKNANIASWEEWCSGMDGLGGLVMLAASLVG